MSHAKMGVDKIICIVRNPTDVFPSYANLFLTVSHTVTLDRDHSDLGCWPHFVEKLATGWAEYHD
jgi:hypothetical protein